MVIGDHFCFIFGVMLLLLRGCLPLNMRVEIKHERNYLLGLTSFASHWR